MSTVIYSLKNCRDGSDATYKTTVEIGVEGKRVNFKFTAENSQYYCPYHNYNDIHANGGDVCEVFIGTDPERRSYYEIEISPENKLMLALIEYNGIDECGNPVLGLDFIDDCFIESNVTKTENGYIAEFGFDLEKINTGDGEIFFNAYRIDTDGGEADKHLFALSPTMRPKFHAPDYFVLLKEYFK